MQKINYKQIMCTIQGFSWTEIYFGHFVQAAPILFGHLVFLGHSLTFIFTTINGNCHLPFSN